MDTQMSEQAPVAAAPPSVTADGKTTGTCKFFNTSKGYGFITPDDGSPDLFVHQSNIHAEGFRSLAEGEPVEFLMETGDDGRTKAVSVTGPQGGFVQGAPRQQQYHNNNQFGGQQQYGRQQYGGPQQGGNGGYQQGGYGGQPQQQQGGYQQGGRW